jgi:uncharacterized membrane protein YccC
MASGALNVSFSDGDDPYVHRARRMFAAGLCCALAVFIGGLCGRYQALTALLVAACGFAAGMMVAAGQTVTDIGNITLVTLIVFSTQSWTPQRAMISGLLALAGALLQMLFALALWPVRRYTPERQALAALYAELTRAAESGAAATEAPPASAASTAAQRALASLAGNHSVDAERLLSLLSQAERIRLTLLALFRIRVRLSRNPATGAAPAAIEQAMQEAKRILASVAESLATGTAAPPADIPVFEAGRSDPALLRDAQWQLEALAGQLRSAVELAAHATPKGSVEFAARQALKPWRLRLESVLDRLRANLHFESAAFRHAIRLSVCVAAGEVVGRTIGAGRPYWVPMTIAIVLRPDFTATFSRGLLRLAGTLIGLAVSTAIFHWLTPGPVAEVFYLTAFTFLLRCFGSANYGVFVTALTALVVLMFAITGISPAQVMLARGVNTLLGGAIALVAYAVWPTWERSQAPEAVAQLIESYRGYFQAVRNAYVQPDRSFGAELDRARLAARLARSNLEASAARLQSEPRAGTERVAALDRILANSHRFIHAVMSLEAGLAKSRAVPAREAFRTFSDHVDQTLYYLAASLRGGKIRKTDMPDLRADHHALVAATDVRQERHALVNTEADRIANSLNTLSENILNWPRMDTNGHE